ncbi:PilN domain-containing protein [Pseudobacteroides cellulosolvens]|uniref:Fimbrial assembly family protein n=1 Tax=Pseudobacteroides cellulosolvens ATCC 35603 = DSM 2933 TaxID=398512 RepID=A0A0L6JJ86_9FIRM|nr:hypothetical protein [Pseudobacteroides cellulosolvens]KNY25809.1 hypothetical protein Bccel_1069 [Pseudobacteroides cellulosolvens ATCC 35603 = DSM 2933]
MKAQKDINLIWQESRSLYRKKILAFSLIFALIVLIGALILAYFIPMGLINNLKLENKELKTKIALLGDIAALTGNLEQKENDYKVRSDLIKVIQEEKVKISEVVKKIIAYLPQDVYITSMTISDGKAVNVSFVVKDPIDAAKLIIKLNESGLFENVDAASLPLTKGNTILTFSLVLRHD